ncbi:uncharacterized protein LOC104455479 [Eucalyptus grandis]|uniref:uncharacterized protein LOC104455479 n=1 Tax=Eucalyptus grandis TaxID=71139 RepID=UPI00192F0C4F|nr:uncharacterized protein LOC104455479 [Eucalyptus grandis]
MPTTVKTCRRLPHGFVGDGILTWQLQVLALARDYAVYAPDLLFFGGSSTGNGRRTVGFQAECLARGLAKLGVQQCTVVGFSYGAVVAFRLAELRPEQVESVVATCSGPVLTESLSRECLERLGFPTTAPRRPSKFDTSRPLLCFWISFVVPMVQRRHSSKPVTNSLSSSAPSNIVSASIGLDRSCRF